MTSFARIVVQKLPDRLKRPLMVRLNPLDDIEVTDITINDRDECTSSSQGVDLSYRLRDAVRGVYCFVDTQNVPSPIRHEIWLGRVRQAYDKVDGDYPAICEGYYGIRANLRIEKIMLKV